MENRPTVFPTRERAEGGAGPRWTLGSGIVDQHMQAFLTHLRPRDDPRGKVAPQVHRQGGGLSFE
jgi:hypothetical protein